MDLFANYYAPLYVGIIATVAAIVNMIVLMVVEGNFRHGVLMFALTLIHFIGTMVLLMQVFFSYRLITG